MFLSKYARKQSIQALARKFSDAVWEKLSQDTEFITYLTGDTFDMTKAQARADQLFPPAKPQSQPQFRSTSKSLGTIGELMQVR